MARFKIKGENLCAQIIVAHCSDEEGGWKGGSGDSAADRFAALDINAPDGEAIRALAEGIEFAGTGLGDASIASIPPACPDPPPAGDPSLLNNPRVDQRPDLAFLEALVDNEPGKTPELVSIGYADVSRSFQVIPISPAVAASQEGINEIIMSRDGVETRHRIRRSAEIGPGDVPVSIATGSAGVIKSVIICKIGGCCRRMVRLGQELPLSDCGSPVVDDASGDLLGHLAMEEREGCFVYAWVIPVRDTFDDLETYLGTAPEALLRGG